MKMESDMKARTKRFSLNCIDLALSLPRTDLGGIISKQLIRAGTSVGANYRAACRAKSKADFIYKLGVVDEEADECMFWMEIIIEKKLQSSDSVKPLLLEANELVSIIVSSIKTARSNTPG